jgi:ectoine hydroxylase-related dioxygenase (phytanoyl-CoA dioxygenase family)
MQLCAAGRPDEPDVAAAATDPDPARTWTAAQLRGGSDAAGSAQGFPAALPASHPAVVQFQRRGYLIISDGCDTPALARAQAAFTARLPAARRVFRRGLAARLDAKKREWRMHFDLPYEGPISAASTAFPEAWMSGAHGGFLVTRQRAGFQAFWGALANSRLFSLLLALLGQRLHILSADARTVPAPPRREAVENGGFTSWHRDHSGETRRLPIGAAGSDFARLKAFTMLTDTLPDGGPLGLMPGSHLLQAAKPPPAYADGNAGALPGHVKAAVPAGTVVLFDQRCWHTGLPLLNGRERHSLSCTYGAPAAAGEHWPVGLYGHSGPRLNFLECGLQLHAKGWLDTAVARQLGGVELA